MTDPIADMLVRIKNASQIKKTEVRLPHSRVKEQLAQVLMSAGFLAKVENDKKDQLSELVLYLKYTEDNEKLPAIRGIKRVSKPGQRIYISKKQIPCVQQGLGVAVLSTSKGLMLDKKARQQGLGGELICTIW